LLHAYINKTIKKNSNLIEQINFTCFTNIVCYTIDTSL
jgi:hypothetical protein